MPTDASKTERLDALYDAHFKAVRAYCARRLPPHEANDAVAEVFATAWARIDDVPGGTDALPYLYGIARHKVAHSRRSFGRRARLRRRVSGLGGPHAPGPESLVLARAEADEVTRALESLRPADQEIIRLRAWEELTPTEVAAVLDIAVPTARKRLSRALDRLGTELRRLESRTVPTRRKEVNDG
jgi:RNA polymerase sigma factor (sigma-70 family)